MEGWIGLHRKIQESSLYGSLSSKQRDVMIQCLLMANHQKKEWEWEGKPYECQRGQFITSLDSITRNCSNDVKVQSVRTALLKLERWGFLTNESTKTGRLITICKWETYQSKRGLTNKANNKRLTKSQQSSNKALTSNKNGKNGKNGKNEKKPTKKESVEVLWDIYPRKTGTAVGKKAITNALDKIDFESLKSKTQQFADAIGKWPKERKQFIPHPSTWYNGERWNDDPSDWEYIDPNGQTLLADADGRKVTGQYDWREENRKNEQRNKERENDKPYEYEERRIV